MFRLGAILLSHFFHGVRYILRFTEPHLIARKGFIGILLMIGLSVPPPHASAQTTHYLTVARIGSESRISPDEVKAILDEAAVIMRRGDLPGDWRALIRLKRRADPCPKKLAPGLTQSAKTAVCVFTHDRNGEKLPSVIEGPSDLRRVFALPSYVSIVKEIWYCATAVGPGVLHGCSRPSRPGLVPSMVVARMTPEWPCLKSGGTVDKAVDGTKPCIVAATDEGAPEPYEAAEDGGRPKKYSEPLSGPYAVLYWKWEAVLWAHEFGHTRNRRHNDCALAVMYNDVLPWNVLLMSENECKAIVKPIVGIQTAHSVSNKHKPRLCPVTH